MKALLLKDWYVLRKQAWAYLITVSYTHLTLPTT